MKKIFHAEWPEMLVVPKGDIEISGIDELRKTLKPAKPLWGVHIDPQSHCDPVWGEFYYVKARAEYYCPQESSFIIGITNFYEQ